MVCLSVSHEREVWKLRVLVLVVLFFICLIFTVIMSFGNLEYTCILPLTCGAGSSPDAGGSALWLHSQTLGPPAPRHVQHSASLISSHLTASL